MKKTVLLLHFILCALVTILIACILQTQMVLHGLSDIGVHISWVERVSMSYQDVVGLLPSYGVIITIGLAAGFGITKWIQIKIKQTPAHLYILAGGVTMAVILAAMHPLLGVTLLAGARSAVGITLQIAAGCIGGYCFMYLRSHTKNGSKTAD